MNYNPASRSTNCGFCAVSRALHVTRDIKIDADNLYDHTIRRLGLKHSNGADPVPRLLIFPERAWDGYRLPISYEALFEHGYDPASYTISAVASYNDLNYKLDLNPTLLNSFLDHFSGQGHGTWSMTDFLEKRLRYLEERGLNPQREVVRVHIQRALCGNSIIGSKSAGDHGTGHYVNLHIDQAGIITAYDAQVNRFYDGRGLKALLKQIDLFMCAVSRHHCSTR